MRIQRLHNLELLGPLGRTWEALRATRLFGLGAGAAPPRALAPRSPRATPSSSVAVGSSGAVFGREIVCSIPADANSQSVTMTSATGRQSHDNLYRAAKITHFNGMFLNVFPLSRQLHNNDDNNILTNIVRKHRPGTRRISRNPDSAVCVLFLRSIS